MPKVPDRLPCLGTERLQPVRPVLAAPGCLQQVYLGFAHEGVPQHCATLEELRGCPGSSGTGVTAQLTAPLDSGTHYVSVRSGMDYDCPAAWPALLPGPGRYVAAI